MGKTYVPGADTDAAVERLVAIGSFATPDDAVRAGVAVLEENIYSA